jgi:hypothetical protein
MAFVRMAYPQPYTRQFDYSGYQNTNPTRPLPGIKVNQDLSDIQRAVGEIIATLQGITRSDGELANGSVGLDQLSSGALTGFEPPTAWAANTAYPTNSTVFYQSALYRANVDHTSTGSFDATKWDELADFAHDLGDATAHWISVGDSGAPIAPITYSTETSDFFLARPDATIGALLQMQYGKGPSDFIVPPPTGVSGIELNMNFNSGVTGSPARYSSGLNIRNNMVAGVAGATLGAFFFADIPTDSTWTPDVSHLGGATGFISLGQSARGGDIFGANPFARATTMAAKSVTGMEIDVDVQAAAAGTLFKQGLQIVDYDTSSGSVVDGAAIHIIAQAGAYGFHDGIRFANVAGSFPIRASGAIIKASGGTVSSGIDFSALGISGGYVLLAPNATYFGAYNVGGTGIKKLIGIDASDFVSLYDGIAKLSPGGTLSLGAAGTGAGVVALNGSTSGTAAITPQAAAGTPTLTIGTASGTIVASATAPLAINATTGVVSITGAALTKTDDTNVTLTLGGSASSALVNAASLTLGWTGTLSVARGGTGISSFGTGVATFLGTPSSANLAAAVTDETGTGALVFATTPTLTSTGTGAGAVAVNGSAVSMLNVTGGSGSGQGAQLALTRGAVQHNFGHAAAILGGTSDDFVIYGSGAANNLRFYANGVLGLTVEPTGRVAFKASTTTAAPISMPSGTAPTSPVDGDFWYDGTNLKFRQGGTTKTVTLT